MTWILVVVEKMVVISEVVSLFNTPAPENHRPFHHHHGFIIVTFAM
jgi:hypothetical protein